MLKAREEYKVLLKNFSDIYLSQYEDMQQQYAKMMENMANAMHNQIDMYIEKLENHLNNVEQQDGNARSSLLVDSTVHGAKRMKAHLQHHSEGARLRRNYIQKLMAGVFAVVGLTGLKSVDGADHRAVEGAHQELRVPQNAIVNLGQGTNVQINLLDPEFNTTLRLIGVDSFGVNGRRPVTLDDIRTVKRLVEGINNKSIPTSNLTSDELISLVIVKAAMGAPIEDNLPFFFLKENGNVYRQEGKLRWRENGVEDSNTIVDREELTSVFKIIRTELQKRPVAEAVVSPPEAVVGNKLSNSLVGFGKKSGIKVDFSKPNIDSVLETMPVDVAGVNGRYAIGGRTIHAVANIIRSIESGNRTIIDLNNDELRLIMICVAAELRRFKSKQGEKIMRDHRENPESSVNKELILNENINVKFSIQRNAGETDFNTFFKGTFVSPDGSRKLVSLNIESLFALYKNIKVLAKKAVARTPEARVSPPEARVSPPEARVRNDLLNSGVNLGKNSNSFKYSSPTSDFDLRDMPVEAAGLNGRYTIGAPSILGALKIVDGINTGSLKHEDLKKEDLSYLAIIVAAMYKGIMQDPKNKDKFVSFENNNVGWEKGFFIAKSSDGSQELGSVDTSKVLKAYYRISNAAKQQNEPSPEETLLETALNQGMPNLGADKNKWRSFVSQMCKSVKDDQNLLKAVQNGASELMTSSIGSIENLYSVLPKSEGINNIYVVQGVDAKELSASKYSTNGIQQCASQFNFLESRSPWYTEVESYVDDSTQGPAASLGSLKALLKRDHAVVHNSLGQQDLFNGMKDKYYKNGYLQVGGMTERELNDFYQRLEQKIADLRILVQSDTPMFGKEKLMQVFNAAASFQFKKVPEVGSTQEKICTLLMKTQYRALGQLAALESIKTGKPVNAHLTMVGQGAFNNPEKAFKEGLEEYFMAVKGYNVNTFIHGYNDLDIAKIKSCVGQAEYTTMGRDAFFSQP